MVSGNVRSLVPGFEKHFVLDPPPPLPTHNFYRVVESLTTIPEGLALCGRKNRWRKLALDANGKLRIGELPERDNHLWMKIAFDVAGQPASHGCLLQTAQWPNGTRVFLDSRGLLHFKSKDPNLPEVSLVLSSGEVAGWTSDGHVCGPAFFFEDGQTSEPAKVFERLQQILNL